MNERVERLRVSLEEPLLVTDPTNLRYLTGLASSNAALLVEPERLRLFTDFRYAAAARAVEGVEFEQTSRSLFTDLARLLGGRIGFEADALVFSRYRMLAEAGIDLVPLSGLVERLRAVKDEGELEAIRRAAAITSEAYARLADEAFVGTTERELARRLDVLLHDLGAEGLAFPTLVVSGPERRSAACARRGSASRGARGRDRGRRCPRRRVLRRLHADLRHRTASGRAEAGLSRLPGGTADRARGGAGERGGPRGRPRRRASGSRPAASARRSATASGTAWACSRTRRLP
jgi:creatinase/prolidase-like protein/peptidase M24-like protein